ncbi:MAG: PfkB family carbohydrate kinase [Paracoccaceae bacterium]|nr:PfkB family carbohydrate kinase [Paracoccaceae bacterium]
MTKILCAGLIAADLVFEMSSFPLEGDKHRAEASHLIGGGGAFIAASAITALGGDVSLVGAIGQDVFGELMRSKITDRGIDDALVFSLPQVPTSRSSIFLSSNGERTIINHRDADLQRVDFLPPDPFRFDAVLVDTRWPDGAASLVQAARKAGKPAVVDAEAPVKIATQALRHASHVVFSEQGLQDFVGSSDLHALQTAVSETGAWCAVTRGPLPVLCWDGQLMSEVPAPSVEVRNTLGAGDAWHGAFTLALGRGQQELDAVRWANAAAAHKVRFSIESETFAERVDVEALMRQISE